MTAENTRHLTLAAGFLATIFGVAAAQVAMELSRGERPRLAGFWRKAAAASNPRIPTQTEQSGWFSQQVRPWVQYAQFIVLGDCGDKAVMGRGGWLFYKPEVQFLIEPWPAGKAFAESQDDPVAAIVSLRDQLADRGIALVVVPAPNKASVYPEMLVAGAGAGGEPVNGPTRRLLAQLEAAGVEVVDLLAVFDRAKAEGAQDRQVTYYLAQDTHWSPEGVRLAAQAVAQRVLQRGWVARGAVRYDLKPIAVSRHGDILEMMQVPQIERSFPPEEVVCSQVIHAREREEGVGSLFPGEVGGLGESSWKKTPDPFQPYADDPASPVLVLGDSFLRIYQRDEPRSAGFIAHLARELGRPLTSLVNDGGGSTLVRQDLSRKPGLLAGKKLVIWEFVERDIRFGTEGWQEVPLRQEIRNPKPQIRNPKPEIRNKSKAPNPSAQNARSDVLDFRS